MFLQLTSKNPSMYWTAPSLICSPLSEFHTRILKSPPPLWKKFVSFSLMQDISSKARYFLYSFCVIIEFLYYWELRCFGILHSVEW